MEPPQEYQALLEEAVEHLMRISDDEAGAWVFVTAPQGSAEMLAALGRLLSTSSSHLTPGSPLVCWATGTGSPDPAWRSRLTEHPGSLWSRLEFLHTVYGPSLDDPLPHGLARLLALDEAAAANLGS